MDTGRSLAVATELTAEGVTLGGAEVGERRLVWLLGPGFRFASIFNLPHETLGSHKFLLTEVLPVRAWRCRQSFLHDDSISLTEVFRFCCN